MAAMEERLQVLMMIQSGQITSEEGARLLEALAEREKTPPAEGSEAEDPDKGTRWVHIRVSDLSSPLRESHIRRVGSPRLLPIYRFLR